MADLDRMVGGLRCRDVLALLADFVDDDLDATTLDRVNAHLSGCDTCEKFGGEYAALVAKLRSGQRRTPSDSGVRTRLSERMGRFWTKKGA
jgi:anti-sigma factor RsiW